MSDACTKGVDALIGEAAAMLRFQGELGLSGLDLPEDLLLRRRAPAPAAPDPSIRPADPEAALRAIREEMGECQRCRLHERRTHIVFGVGNPRARLLFIGEGPGRDEDLQGEPFVGAAGQLLDRMIAAMGLARADVYIANLVKCRPPRNRDPGPDEIAACGDFLHRQIETIRPEAIVTLGRCAAQTLLAPDQPRPPALSRLRGRWHAYGAIPVMPTFHPAYLLRYPNQKRPVWQDLQEVMARLGLKDPRQKG